MRMKAKINGFTLIEITIVLIMIGILTASMLPLLLRQHSNTMEGRDRAALLDAQTAIINYAITFGGIPNASGVAGAASGVMPSVLAFGVNNWGAFGSTNPFMMDVNSNLLSSSSNAASSVGGDKLIFCQAVNAQMQIASGVAPFICQDYASDHLGTVAAPACPAASAVPVAFVLYSTGNDHTANQGNASINRIYENDKRGINNSPGNSHYDDLVMSYPMTALVRDCKEKMGLDPNVMSCPVGYKYVGSVMNSIPASTASSVSYTIGTTAGTVSANSSMTVKSCQASGVSVSVSGITASTSLTQLDQNKDGWIDILFGWSSASGVTASGQ